MDSESYVMEEKQLPEELIRNPYKYICDFAEEILPHAGRKIFQILSLMPPSLVLPDLIYKGKKIRSNINVLFLSSPGGGKSTASEILQNITYSPISVRSVTPAKLTHKIHENPFFTLIVEDYATMSEDDVVGKIIEGILGEEKRIQRSTMKGEIDDRTEGIGLLCGTPSDLAEHLSGGLLFRLVPLVIFHNMEEHSSIGKDIAEGIGSDNHFEEKEKIIKDYYLELLKIQNDENKQVLGYYIPKEFSEKAYKYWDIGTMKINKRTNAPFNYFRSLHEFFRFLVSHAFLNVFNRKVEKGILYPNEEDFNVALKLMKNDLNMKYKILSMNIFIRNITTTKELFQIINSDKLSEEQKGLIQNLIKVKGNKIVSK